MTLRDFTRSGSVVSTAARFCSLSLALTLLSTAGCAPRGVSPIGAPQPDPRVGLRGGKFDAAQALWNLRLVSNTPPPTAFDSAMNSDLAFIGPYAIQGNFNGYQVWDISDPAAPTLTKAYLCPASQSDVSVYRNLLFVSGESLSGRLDCGRQGVKDSVSKDRLRGLRIFDITDIRNPKYVANVQTCRGSHTHTVLVDPKDAENVYVYISGSSRVRSPNELPGCVNLAPERDPNSALFRIEVIKVPLAHPERAAIVSSPRIFDNLVKPAAHGETAADLAAERKALAQAKATGGFTGTWSGRERVLDEEFIKPLLDSIVQARNGTGAPTAADSAALRAALPRLVALAHPELPVSPNAGPTQCHDITVYPAIGLAGGACAGYGFLLDIRNPVNPVRIGAVADSNFAYWHSATFNNDGTKILFTDEWGGGTQPKCRRTDRPEWGANAIFTLGSGTSNRPVMVSADGSRISGSAEMEFQSYYKIPAAQTPEENCVAHNGSLIPIPGRDVMVQAWYQGGISVFDWTDPSRPVEIAFFDRGPVDSTRMVMGGSWSAYWYNGYIVSSEIARGLDILELVPSPYLSANEIAAAKTVRFDYYNAQGQPKLTWPPSFALARAYLDQLERSKGLSGARLAAIRDELRQAELAGGEQRRSWLAQLAGRVAADAGASRDEAKVRALVAALRDLAGSER